MLVSVSERVESVGLVLIGCKGLVARLEEAGTACSEVPFAVGWDGRGLLAVGTGAGDEVETGVLV